MMLDRVALVNSSRNELELDALSVTLWLLSFPLQLERRLWQGPRLQRRE